MGQLIHLSEAAFLAIHCVALVAGSRESLNAATMAQRLGASRNHLAKVLQQLVKHNYLSSTRGPRGGFTMRTVPDKISLYEIYVLMEGKPEVEYCQSHASECPFSDCVFGNIREKLTGQFIEYLMHRKISDLIKITMNNL